MSVKVNGQEYHGLGGLLLAIPVFLFISVVFIFVSLLLLSPFILIGLIVWAVSQ